MIRNMLVAVVGSALLFVGGAVHAEDAPEGPPHLKVVCECACESADHNTHLEGGVIVDAPFGDPGSCGNLTADDNPVRCNTDDPPQYLQDCKASTVPAIARLVDKTLQSPGMGVADPGRTEPAPAHPVSAASTVVPARDQ